jgi:hypothetical protein
MVENEKSAKYLLTGHLSRMIDFARVLICPFLTREGKRLRHVTACSEDTQYLAEP